MTAVNFFAAGHNGDLSPDFHVGKMSPDGLFLWAMRPNRLEFVLVGLAEKHCETCTCGDEQEDGTRAVIEDDSGTSYTRMEFAQVFILATREDRSLAGTVFS
jgi:hypothetical protein